MKDGEHDKRSARGEDDFSDVDSERDSYGEGDRLVAEDLEKDGQPLVGELHVDGAAGVAGASKLRERGLRVKTEKSKKKEYVGWMDLPRKGQLIVLTLARLSEPLVQTSLQSYMFYQLKWFDPSQPDSAVASQAGIISASFPAAQFLTAMMWGRLADSPRFGRKSVLLIGLCGTCISVLGFGFATKFWHALLFRSIGGALNGNVGVLRTMISEIVREKKYQSRAFLLMPMTFNIGVIIGPILGGILSDPAGNYPQLFGGVEFLKRFPYAAPNLLSAFFLFSAFVGIWMGLEETLDARLDKRDRGIELRKSIASLFRRCFRRNTASPIAYTQLSQNMELELSPVSSRSHSRTSSSATDASTASTSSRRPRARYTQRLPFRRIFTKNVTLTLLAHATLAFHIGTFNSLWFVFLSTPVFDPAHPAPLPRQLPFLFTGGIGLPPHKVGLAMAILGAFGIALQLLLYPSLSARLGTVRSWRLFLLAFPLAYLLAPFLALAPSTAPPPAAKAGVVVWLAIAAVLFVQVLGRTFALPAQTILVNNCTPHPSVLGTLHGLAQSFSSLTRTIGPMLCGWLYGRGLEGGVVGAVWWGLSGVALFGVLASLAVKEGDGHEVWLEGDVEDEVEGEMKERKA